MAVLTAVQLRRMHKEFLVLIGDNQRNFTKTEIDEVFQAFEDQRASTETALFTALDVATAPKVFTTPRKKRLQEAFWLVRLEDGVP